MTDIVLEDADVCNNIDQQQFYESKETIRKYRALVSTSNTGAWEYFPETGFFDCNSVYFSILGRDINDYNFKGKKNLNETWIDLLHPDDKEAATSRLINYLSEPHGMYENFFRMQHATGNWVWICSRGGFLKDETGKNCGSLIGTHIDITKQKQAEEDIQHERILLRTLIDNLPDTIYVKDAEGRKIIANTADVIAIGFKTEGDVIGKTDLELFPNKIGLRGYNDDMEVLKTGEPLLNKEEFFYEKDGNQRWLLTSKVPVFDAEGKPNRILGIGHDITERKRSEEALNNLNTELNLQSAELSKQAEELKALNELLIQQKEQELEKAIAQGKFEIASEVLHDIGNALVGFGSYLTRINRIIERNNLDGVKNLNQYLKTQQTLIGNAIGADKANALVSITEGISKTQAENQKEVSSSINELLNIVSHIQEILNIQRQFVRSHAGNHERKPVNIAQIIDDCRSMLFASLDKKGVRLNVNIKAGSHVIKGDHTKLMQVILNILKNSLEAIDMEKSEKSISITLESTDKCIGLKIVDSGQGFDKETSKRFFERGFTTKKSGTGLGLYNCKSIVESHAGTFEITSEGPGLGAVTTIKFEI
jgi:PAS domain S-box-containing protein